MTKEWYAANHAYKLAYQRQYYARNAEARKAYQREYAALGRVAKALVVRENASLVAHCGSWHPIHRIPMKCPACATIILSED